MEKIDETKRTEETEKKDPAGDTEEGDKPKTPKVIVDANTAAERMEKANEKREELLAREEALAAERQIGGTAEGGMQPVKEEPISNVEYSKKVDRGEANPLKEDGFL